MNIQALIDKAVDQIIKSVQVMIQKVRKESTKIYNGIVVSNNGDGRWNIRYNGEVHAVKLYGETPPMIDSTVKVFVPQGNQNLAWFITPPIEGGGGGTGTSGVDSFNGRTGTVIGIAGDYTAAMVGARPNTWLPTPDEIGAVPETTTVNGKSLSSNITLQAGDVGAVPTSRTVNGQALSNDVTLTGSNIAVSTSDSTTVDAALAGTAVTSYGLLQNLNILDWAKSQSRSGAFSVAPGCTGVPDSAAWYVGTLEVNVVSGQWSLHLINTNTGEGLYNYTISGDWVEWSPVVDSTLSNLTNYQKALYNIGGRPNKNLLDNWYFVGGGSQQGGGQFPINQRGQTSYTGGIYGIDRWFCAQVTLQSEGINIPYQNGNMFQRLESELKAFLNGKTVTFSVLLADNSLISGSLVYKSSLDNQEYFAVDKVHLVLAVNGEILLWASQNVTLIAAKLELGPTQTLAYQDEEGNWQLFETPDYAEELAKCQRYAQFGPLVGLPVILGYVSVPLLTSLRASPMFVGSAYIYKTNDNSLIGERTLTATQMLNNTVSCSTGVSELCYASIPAGSGFSADL